MGNFTKAHAKWWDNNAKETEKADSKRKKAIMSAQADDDKPRNIYEAIAPQRRPDGSSSGDGGQSNRKPKSIKEAPARTPENFKMYEAIAPQRPLTKEEIDAYNKKKKLRSR